MCIRDSVYALLRTQVPIEPGENKIALRVPELYRLTVLLAEIPVGAEITLRRKLGDAWNLIAEARVEKKTFVYDALPTGEYLVSLECSLKAATRFFKIP